MPKSKRSKVVNLTKTDRKGREGKAALMEEIHKCCDEYSYIYIFSVENMRNSKLKEVRNTWRDSRFFFGKNKVMMLAFGRAPEDEYKKGTHKVSKYLRGSVGVLFTNKSRDYVESWFKTHAETDFARSGNEATEKVSLEAGPLPQFSHSMEPQLRKLGMPTSLQRGVVTLTQNFTICHPGQALTPQQARMLKLFGKPMALFQIIPLTVWHEGELEELAPQDVIAEDATMEADEDED